MPALLLSEPGQIDDLPPAGANFPRVLVPVDFSVCTLETLHYARDLAEQRGAMVDVLHVIPERLGGRAENALPPGWRHTMPEGARQELLRLIDRLRSEPSAANYAVRVREGCPHEVILREAGATKATLIIMSRRHRTWLSGWRRHRTVQRVLENSPCPVLVLPRGRLAGRVTATPR